MAVFKRDIGAPKVGFTGVTPMVDPVDSTQKQVVDTVGKGLTGVVQGAAEANLQASVRRQQDEILGTDMSTVTTGDVDDMGNQVVAGVSDSAQSLERQVAAGTIKPMEAEARLRRRLAGIKANPVLSAFSGRASNAAGARAGSGKGVDDLISQSTAGSKIAAAAAGQKKAITDFEQKAADAEARGIPREIFEEGVKQTALAETATKNLEAQQSMGAVDFAQASQVNAMSDATELDGLIAGNLNEEGKIDIGGMAGIASHQAGKLRDRTIEIEGSTLSRANKDKQIAALEKKHAVSASYVKTLSQSSYNESFAEFNKNKNAAEAYELAPIQSWLRDTGQLEALKYTSNMSLSQVTDFINTKFGDGTALSITSAVEGVEDFFDTTKTGPMTNSVLGLAAPDAETALEENQNNPTWKARLKQNILDKPGETMYSLNGSPLEASAQAGDGFARTEVASTFNTVLEQVQGQLQLHGGAIGITTKAGPSTKGVRGAPRKSIDMPDGMSNKGEQLNQMYRMVGNNVWMWPEGSTSGDEAFNMIMNENIPVGIGGKIEEKNKAAFGQAPMTPLESMVRKGDLITQNQNMQSLLDGHLEGAVSPASRLELGRRIEDNMAEFDELIAVDRAKKEGGGSSEAPQGPVSNSKPEARAMADPKLAAVVKVETGGESDPFLRTRAAPTKEETAEGAKGSTAYGPLQVTNTLAADVRERMAPKFSDEEKAYLDRFIKQGKKFAKFGNEPEKEGYDAKYEYGGEGDLTSDKDRAMYWQVFEKVFDEVVGENATAEEIAKKWHGGSDEKLIKEYADKLRAAGIAE